jgi:hypothetical protein
MRKGVIKLINMKKLTNEEFLYKIWNINPSYKERFCYKLCVYTGRSNKIKITCKNHNYLFETLPLNHFRNAKKEIQENIILTGGCNECISCIRKANIYKNNNTNFPENYNENDWKIIEDFEDYYINYKGDIWSKLSNKLIKSYVNESGYLVATLYTKSTNKNSKKRVHILVAESFVNNPNPELYNIVNHIDGNRENPLYTNLEWTNRSGNTKHAHKNPENYKEIKSIIINKVETDNEYWGEILPHFPGYFISNFGNVKSISVNGKRENQLSKNNSSIKHDHFSVGLRDTNNKFHRKQVHRLVIEYHLKVKYDTSNMIVDHKDNNKQNNYIGNLEWVNNHINTQRAMIEGCWNRKDRKQNVSHIRYIKWSRNKNIYSTTPEYKYHICMNISGYKINRFADTKKEAIQKKKELYAIMIITNYIKFKKGLYTKYYKLNINFNDIDNEINLL